MKPTIPDTGYAILRALVARGRVVKTKELRQAIGFDPHPMLRRDIVGRNWAQHRDSLSEEMKGAQITELGRAAFELGRLERGDSIPEPVGPPISYHGSFHDPKFRESNENVFDEAK